MNPIPSARTPGGRARIHIKALIEEAKHQTADAPAPAQMFFSGMLSGLAAAVEILDGGTAEGSMETIVTRLSAAIGQAYLDGQLPPQPSAPETLDALRARAKQAEDGRIAADNMLRAVCDVFGGPHQDPIVKARETRARAEQAEAAIERVQQACHDLRHKEAGRILAALDGAEQATTEAALDGQPTRDPIAEENARRHKATIARVDELLADAERVRALYERWVKAGPPPLGTSMARWWDARLAEFHNAIHDPPQETP